MRIISGTYKGRRFSPPASLKARPTTDFAKEGLFNVLGNQLDIEDTQVLDLFAGSGSISFEFVSRGAAHTTSVEQNYQHIAFIKKVTQELGIKNISVLKADVFRYIESCKQSFDIIFADPPYALPQLAELPDKIMQSDILKKEGLFILEHGKSNTFTTHPNFVEFRHYGNVHFSFFKHS
jgi:16S rRNA (guanine966-N2)-methyltransferase